MSDAQIESRNQELKTKKICRFCLSQNDQLTNIYSRENRLKSSAPLPLQVMACVSIEVFTNDGMPTTICDYCRMLMEHCYRFKQMCKKADNVLRQFPLTGVWPPTLELPKIPEELVQKQYPDLKKPKEIKFFQNTNEIRSPPVKAKPALLQSSSSIVASPSSGAGRPVLLNKNSTKILNKNVETSPEPILSKPKIKRDDAGNVEIVTEILNKVEEPDPVKSAVKVETNVFPCPHCERSFPLRQLLDIHMVNHNRERSFECSLCDKRFFSKYDLGKHMLIHTGEKPYECVVCKKAFTRSTLLYRHEKIHTDQPKFLCVYCEKPFLSTEELEKHTLRHKKKRPFCCKICGKRFAFKQGLERHETVHAKDQPYPCQYCDLSFSTPSKLSRHLTAHAGDRPFPCKLCPKSYLLSHHLTRHLRSHSQGSGSYKCYDCEKTFTTRDDLIYHSAVHATQTLVCPLCKEHFSDLDLVTEHIKEHAEGEQYACEFCDLIFMTPEKLQAHSDADHSDDLAAYKEHTQSQVNIKREANLQYVENSQDMPEEGEVIQEFIIEEYHHDDNGDIMEEVSMGTLVKQENQNSDVREVSSKTTSVRPTISQRTQSANNRAQAVKIYQSEITSEEEDFDMEIETLEREDDVDSNYENQEEIYNKAAEQPPLKVRKVSTQQTNARETIEKVERAPNRSKFLLHNKKVSEEKIVKSRQPTISSMLQQLPKSVTVVKKDKSLAEKRSDIKEIRILNQQTKDVGKVEMKMSPPTEKVTSVKARIIEKRTYIESDVKTKVNKSPSPSTSIAKLEPLEKTTKSQLESHQPSKKLVEMIIGDRKVKVQKIMMTKAEVAAMAKEGKIEMKGGTMILKQDKTPVKNKTK